MGIKTFYITVFGGFFGCFAQEKPVSNPYFKSYDDNVIASMYYLDVSNTFRFVTSISDGSTIKVDLIPNHRQQIGMSVSYKFVDVSYGISPQFFNANKDNGDSKLFNISTRFIVKQWMQTLTFINQKGFYVNEFDAKFPFPDMRSTKIGGVTSYIFNPNFSFKTIANQKQWQTKSSGSFVPNFAIFYTNLDLNDGPPSSQSDILEIALSPSYYYNFVINNQFLISAGVAVGGGISKVDSDISGVVESNISLKTGYNTDSFFAFLNLNYFAFGQNSDAKIQLNDTISTLNFTLGYRFAPPKKVEKVFETVHQKTGL
jgi:Domain of unknown function (DUF4421)